VLNLSTRLFALKAGVTGQGEWLPPGDFHAISCAIPLYIWGSILVEVAKVVMPGVGAGFGCVATHCECRPCKFHPLIRESLNDGCPCCHRACSFDTHDVSVATKIAFAGDLFSLVEDLTPFAHKVQFCAMAGELGDQEGAAMEGRNVEDILQDCRMPLIVSAHAGVDVANASCLDGAVIAESNVDGRGKGGKLSKPFMVRAHGSGSIRVDDPLLCGVLRL
jgi:hypothetical protein